jgi:aspartyl/asparaginyl-tRNA synthetase
MTDFTKLELEIIYHAVKRHQTLCESKVNHVCQSVLNKISSDIKLPIEPAYDINSYERTN